MVLKKVEVTIMCVKISKSDIIKTTMLLEMVLCFDGDSFKLFKLDTRVVSTKSIFQPSLSMCIFCYYVHHGISMFLCLLLQWFSHSWTNIQQGEFIPRNRICVICSR